MNCKAAFTLTQDWITLSLHGLPSVALYCKQCYFTWTLHYVRHNNDVIIDVKTFWRPCLLFSWRKRGTCAQNCSYFKVTRTRTEIVLLRQVIISTLLDLNRFNRGKCHRHPYHVSPTLGTNPRHGCGLWSASDSEVNHHSKFYRPPNTPH